MKIDRTSSLPLYEQVKEMISDEIRRGTYKSGDRIPAETELCKRFGVSRPTVRQAVADLVSQGILVIERGRGTFVCASEQTLELPDFSAFAFSLLAADFLADQAVIQSGPASFLPPYLLEAYGIDPQNAEAQKVASEFHEITRLEEKEGVLYAATTSFIPLVMFPDLPEQIAAGRSLLEITANKYAFLPVRSDWRLRSETCDQVTAMALNCPHGAPLFTLQAVFYARSGDICEVCETKLRSDIVELRFTEDIPPITRRNK